MNKQTAMRLLGPAVADVARACRVTRSAVAQWPEELPSRIEDRVLAALARRHLPPELCGEAGGGMEAPKPNDPTRGTEAATHQPAAPSAAHA